MNVTGLTEGKMIGKIINDFKNLFGNNESYQYFILNNEISVIEEKIREVF